MSTFQGFNVTGVDRNKSPVIWGDKPYLKQFSVVLEPTDAAPSTEDLTLWRYYFIDIADNWENYSEFNGYKSGAIEIPQLTFDHSDEDGVFICASGIVFNSFRGSISLIKDLVKWANKRFILEVNGFRESIDQLNSDIFGN